LSGEVACVKLVARRSRWREGEEALRPSMRREAGRWRIRRSVMRAAARVNSVGRISVRSQSGAVGRRERRICSEGLVGWLANGLKAVRRMGAGIGGILWSGRVGGKLKLEREWAVVRGG
jgi:hypothetical protein